MSWPGSRVPTAPPPTPSCAGPLRVLALETRQGAGEAVHRERDRLLPGPVHGSSANTAEPATSGIIAADLRPTRSRAAFTPCDVALLAETDESFGQLSGPARKVILCRMFQVHGDMRFERLASISTGHIYNRRKPRECRTGRLTFPKTRATPASSGVRCKPQPHGRPGFLRVDTVHLGDRRARKGNYIINAVDEVTQFQRFGAVRRVSPQFTVPILEDLISAFPFTAQASPTFSTTFTSTPSRSPGPANRTTARSSSPRTAASSANGSATYTSPTPSSPRSTPSSGTTSVPSSTSTGPASSPPRSPEPTAASSGTQNAEIPVIV